MVVTLSGAAMVGEREVAPYRPAVDAAAERDC